MAARRGKHRVGRKWRPIATRARQFLGPVILVLLLGPFILILAYRIVPPPITPLMVIRLLEGEGLSRDWERLERISPHLPRAVVAAEDNLFCEHHGFDWEALEEAVEAYFSGERAPGGSTITMQTAKNVLLWPGRDVLRKVLELSLTPIIDGLWPKRRIMEVYLNVVELGPGIYGAEAAARHFFGKPAAELTRSEANRLAAVLPNPRAWSPLRPNRRVRNKAAKIETRLRQLGPLLDCVTPQGAS